MSEVNQYPIPLYLNQKYVFDILAMMENEFHQLETIKTNQNEQQDESKKYSGKIGLRNVFALIGVSFSPERATKTQASEAKEVTVEKVHTPNSLFSRMREQLYEQNLIVSSKLSDVKSGDFVEFKITLRKNPLTDALESVKALWQLALSFQEPQTQQGQKSKKLPENTNQKSSRPD